MGRGTPRSLSPGHLLQPGCLVRLALTDLDAEIIGADLEISPAVGNSDGKEVLHGRDFDLVIRAS